MQLSPAPLTIASADGYALKALYYSKPESNSILVIGSATGVPQGYYRRFAEYALDTGFDVITFDYRGIGQSAPTTLKGFDIDYRDWARFDLQAVVDYAVSLGKQLAFVGHSYGGQALGLLSTPHVFRAATFFGTGAGWQGWMPKMERLKVSLMWNVVGPVLTRRHGFLRWSKLGMGEDLPLGVYRQWKRWCQFPEFFFEDPDYAYLIEQFAKVSMPIRALTSVDDKWASPRSRDAFMKYYTGSNVSNIDIHPRDVGMKSIGHMGYFRAAAKALWEQELALLNLTVLND
ncbi:alpha/beta fold hydrolase [Aestuariibacter salexigens]|uniref:alpha/beta hydrolase family protein n=1 Tax=Aestuariibacter salexigens TaxID=226010 RepID=UPI0003FDEDA8|nr:alpha/beta fold hydrolase [Aestuariibacter salexigens]